MSALDHFTPATRSWFEASFPAPTPAQELGWDAVVGMALPATGFVASYRGIAARTR